MNSQKRNLTQEFETLLNGRSILDLTGQEASLAVNMLTKIVKSKPLKSLTTVELQALIEELTEIVAINLFKGDLPDDWETKIVNQLNNSDEKEWGWSFASILDFYLHDVEMWDSLSAEDREIVAKTILKYLEGEEYHDYFIGYIEDYLDGE